MDIDLKTHLSTAFHYCKDKSAILYHYVVDRSKPHFEYAVEKMQPVIEKSKQFYQEHKEVILVIGAATATYLIVRPRNKESQKLKKRKTMPQKVPPQPNKTFVSDDSEDELREEPSTTIRVESSGRQMLKKKGNSNKMLERIESSSSGESGDKIFFAMYRNYQES